MAKLGQLQVTVENPSYFLSENLPYVVRDASMSFVAQGTIGQKGVEDLPEGYYAVEVLTPSGAPRTEVVHVVPDAVSMLVIGDDDIANEDQPAGAAVGGVQPPWLSAPADGLATAGEPRLEDARHCRATRLANGWSFAPDGPPTGTPTAHFSVGDGSEWVISLPINPAGREDDETGCFVTIERPGNATARPVASFSPHRRVSRLLDGVVRHHQTARAGLLEEAAGLLFYKYSDPSAAALGGLTLHRLGRLRERQGWVENLARHFTWIPDGQILLAALLMHEDDPAERHRGLELLLGAASARPLYTDGLSLASDLLRRWPDDEQEPVRAARLGLLSGYSSTADWDAVMLTTQVG